MMVLYRHAKDEYYRVSNTYSQHVRSDPDRVLDVLNRIDTRRKQRETIPDYKQLLSQKEDYIESLEHKVIVLQQDRDHWREKAYRKTQWSLMWDKIWNFPGVFFQSLEPNDDDLWDELDKGSEL